MGLSKCEVEGCGEPELTQGRCYGINCPKCHENPCNGSVSDPECGVCIMAYRPDGESRRHVHPATAEQAKEIVDM